MATKAMASQATFPPLDGSPDYANDDFTICDADGVVVKCITGDQTAYANYCAGLRPVVANILNDLAKATGKPLVTVLYPLYDQYLANNKRHHAACDSFYHVVSSFGFICNLTPEASKARDMVMYAKACLVWQLQRREYFPPALDELVSLDEFKALLLEDDIAVYEVNNFLTCATTVELSDSLDALVNTY